MKTKTCEIAYSPQSAWKDYAATATRRKELESLAKRYIDFLSACKTERETIAYVQRRLAEKGFTENPRDGLFMRPLRGKALFAARRGKAPLAQGLRLIAAHADTPRLDFKQRPFIEQPGVTQAKTHYYGGIRKYQWLALPLSLRGVVALENGKNLAIAIGDRPGDPVFTIADLLPHLAQKQAGQPVSEAFEAEKLNIILSHAPAPGSARSRQDEEKEPLKAYLLQLLNEKYGVREEDFISADMQAVPAGPARFVGLDRALIGGYGQDDRICVFTALEAFLTAKAGRNAPNTAIMFWDKEEIGSDGATGASSRFLQFCVEDITRAWAGTLPVSQVFLNSRAISADVTGAFDPDFPEVHEKQNAAQLGYGPCFSKCGGSRGKYGASEADAEFVGELRGLLNARNIPWQIAELGKVDVGGGGTVALFLAAYGMQVIDCGPALLSMHSPFELSSSVDVFATAEAYRAFLEG